MYRFLLTRRWLIASAVVLAAVVTMVELGLWQLRRMDEVRSSNAVVRSRMTLAAVPIEEVLGARADTRAATYRRVTATGRYDAERQVEIDNRSFQGRGGRHLVTPLITSSGVALLVDRGWVPLDTSPERAAPPAEARVSGVLFAGERKGALGPAIPPTGTLFAMPRIDVARIAKQLPYETYPLYLRLRAQSPAQGSGLPVFPELPALEQGPHLSYAVQWFLFATVAVSVFVALIRREGRRRVRERPAP